MPSQLWSQDVFSRGELSPYMRARVSVNQYYQGLRTAKNVLTYPQGAAGKRFGTLYMAVLNAGITNYDQIFFQTFQYLNECVYQILFRPLAIDIYLEGILIASVVTTLDQTDVWNLDYTVIDNRFRVSGEGFRPKDLIRSASAANVLVSITANEFDLTTPVTSGLIVPVKITTSGTLPTTVPAVKAGVTYFAKYTSTTTAKLYATSKDAADDVNEFTLSSLGTCTNNIVPQNTWAFSNVTFKNYPVYDFNGGYDTYTFTPSAISGAAVTLTSSTAIFHDYHVGGAYVGGGGTSASSTYIYIAIRRGPMKTPTTGTQVFNPQVQTTTGSSFVLNSSSGFPVDWLPNKQKNNVIDWYATNRLTNNYLSPNTTAAQGAFIYGFDLMQGLEYLQVTCDKHSNCHPKGLSQ